MSQQITREEYYKRQLSLKEFGAKELDQLEKTKILIIGAGGLGNPVAGILSNSGVGNITLIDFDQVESSNLHRQGLFELKDIGRTKVEALSDKLLKRNPFVKTKSIVDSFCPVKYEELIEESNLVIECSDSLETKFNAHDICQKLKTNLIIGSVFKFEGQVQTFVFENFASPCLRCLWEKCPDQSTVGSCAEVGVLPAVSGLIGNYQAMEATKLLLGLGKVEHGITYNFDFLDYSVFKTRITKKKGCRCEEELVGVNIEASLQVSRFDKDTRIIDIRSEDEFNNRPSPLTSENIPLENFKSSLIQKDERVLFICERGIRSLSLVRDLRQKGFANTFSLIQKM